MKTVIWVVLFMSVLSGCSENREDEGYTEGEMSDIVLSVSNELRIDRSLVFFYRKKGSSDTLIYRAEIVGPTQEQPSFRFQLPAGDYQMILIGNGEVAHVLSSGGLASSDVLIEYANGQEPPDLYYATNRVKVGEQTTVIAGMLHLTARIALTVKDVPAGVDKIVAVLKNTSVGVYLNLNISNKVIEPAISHTIDTVVPGSSPMIRFSCFPTIRSAGNSFLDVKCYDKEGVMLYSGASAPFVLVGSEAITVTCSFAGTNSLRQADVGNEGEEEYLSFSVYKIARRK